MGSIKQDPLIVRKRKSVYLVVVEALPCLEHILPSNVCSKPKVKKHGFQKE